MVAVRGTCAVTNDLSIGRGLVSQGLGLLAGIRRPELLTSSAHWDLRAIGSSSCSSWQSYTMKWCVGGTIDSS